MVFVAPGGDARQLIVDGHGAAVIGAVLQVAVKNAGIPGYETRSQAGQVAAFGQAVEHHAAGVVIPANGGAGLQEAFRRVAFLRIEFGVAFVGSNDKVVFVGQGYHPGQRLPGDNSTTGIARGAQKQYLAFLPDGFGH